MPTYEYVCNACHGEFEAEKRMSDPPDAACPSCGSPDTRRLISHSSFVLKGSGWYVTDYARKNGGGSGGTGHKPAESPKDPAPATPPAPAAAPTPAPAPAAAAPAKD